MNGTGPERTVELGPFSERRSHLFIVYFVEILIFSRFFSNFVFDRMHNDNIFNLSGLGFLAFDFFFKIYSIWTFENKCFASE